MQSLPGAALYHHINAQPSFPSFRQPVTLVYHFMEGSRTLSLSLPYPPMHIPLMSRL